MRWYPWLRPDFEKLVASYQAGRGHHALLIQALPGMGDDALIYALSRYLLCQQPVSYTHLCRRCSDKFLSELPLAWNLYTQLVLSCWTVAKAELCGSRTLPANSQFASDGI